MTFQINVVDIINQGDVAASGNIENTSGVVPNTLHFSHQLPFEFSFEFCPWPPDGLDVEAEIMAAFDAEVMAVEAEIMAFDI